jgi:Ser/Thr protein kinase RdoA (MazF antagonist)
MKEFGSLRQVFIPYLEKKIRQIYAFGEEITVRYLTFSENFTYVLYRGQKPIGIISLHKPGYHTPGELYDELVWMHEVRQETAVHVPQIFNGRNGGFLYAVTLPDDGGRYYFSVTEYLPGKTLESAEDGCAEAWAERVGEITAMLHVQSCRRATARPQLNCFQWDLPRTLGAQARWGNFNLYPVKQDEQDMLNKAARKIIEQLQIYGKSDANYFLIHADLHTGNLMTEGSEVSLIDFDDCGYSWFLYDLGAFMSRQSVHLQAVIDSWCSGYERIRPLSAADIQMIPAFVLMRRLVRLGWLATRKDNDVVSQDERRYLEKTLELAGIFV